MKSSNIVQKYTVRCKWTDGSWRTINGKKLVVPISDSFFYFEKEVRAASKKQALFFIKQEICKKHNRKVVVIYDVYIAPVEIKQLSFFNG